MSNYVTKALHKFQQPTPRRAQYVPHQWTRLNHGATKQLTTPLDILPQFSEEQKLRIKKIVGNLLYYSHNVDCIMLPTINTIAEQQANPTQNNEAAIARFLYYAGTITNGIFQYKVSDTVRHIDSDASHLSKPRALNRTEGH